MKSVLGEFSSDVSICPNKYPQSDLEAPCLARVPRSGVWEAFPSALDMQETNTVIQGLQHSLHLQTTFLNQHCSEPDAGTNIKNNFKCFAIAFFIFSFTIFSSLSWSSPVFAAAPHPGVAPWGTWGLFPTRGLYLVARFDCTPIYLYL